MVVLFLLFFLFSCVKDAPIINFPPLNHLSITLVLKKKDLLCHQFQNFEALVHYVILIAQEVLLVLFFQPNQAGRNMDKKGDSKPIFDG